jgi:hypothetical protein
MSAAQGAGSFGDYEVGVAIAPLDGGQATRHTQDNLAKSAEITVPGYDDVRGRGSGEPRRSVVIERGAEAVRIATESLAQQIGLAAQRIASEIDKQDVVSSASENFALESVEVSFGVSLLAGIQTIFTAQAESSAQVTVRLSRKDTGKSPDGQQSSTDSGTR